MAAPRFALAILSAFLLALPALAQVGEQTEVASFAMTGRVQAVDAAKGTLTIEAANREGGVLDVDPKAEIMSGDRTLGLADVKPGWHVVLNGDIREGKRVVTYLEVVDAP